MQFNKANIKSPLDERNEAFMNASNRATDEYLEQNQSNPMAFMDVLKGSILPVQEPEIPFAPQDRSPASMEDMLPENYNELAQEEALGQSQLPPNFPMSGGSGDKYAKILEQIKAMRSGSDANINDARKADSQNQLMDSLSKSAQGIGDAIANRAGYTKIKSDPISLKSNLSAQAEGDSTRKREDLMNEYKMMAGKDQADAQRLYQQQMLQVQKNKDERADKYLTEKQKTEARIARNAEANMVRGVLKDDPIYKDVSEQGRAFSELNEYMPEVLKGNQVAISGLGTKLAKAMGEKGPLTDSDVTRYLGSVSWGRQLKKWYDGGAKGELPKDILRDLQANIGSIQKTLNDSEKKVYNKAASRIKTIYPEKPTDEIYGILGYKPQDSVNSSVSNQDEKALEWAKKNSTDPRAAKILSKLGK